MLVADKFGRHIHGLLTKLAYRHIYELRNTLQIGKFFSLLKINVTKSEFSKCLSDLLRPAGDRMIGVSCSSTAYQEIAMLFNPIRHLITWLTSSHATTASDQPAPLAEISSALEFDPMWHGDHWQNLLSSPMDARRYVIEDWSVSTADWTEADGAAPAH
jgi:hypothetical protein